jgi:hypothetical protein
MALAGPDLAFDMPAMHIEICLVGFVRGEVGGRAQLTGVQERCERVVGSVRKIIA